ncbi:MAG: YihY/virulence factor BrkB family protein [Actinobacteria bacterium]|nr:YihY/virulence factor BrkB family protein [Actinomycetota bacterium]
MTDGAGLERDRPDAEREEAYEELAGAAGPERIQRSRFAETRRRATDAYRRLEESRSSNRLIDTGFEVYDRDVTSGGGVLSGAVAFRAFLWLIPFAFVFVALFAQIATLQDKDSQEVARNAGITGLAAKAIADAHKTSEPFRWISVLAGIVILAWTSLGMVRALRAVHALAWRLRLPRMRRAWRAVLVFNGVALGSLAMISWVGHLRLEGHVAGFVATGLAVLLFFGIWLLASWLLPRPPDAPWTALVPGAILVAVVEQAVHLFMVLYVSHHLESASDTYGGLGAAIALLGGLYIFARVIVGSAVLNATLWDRRQRAITRP